MSAPPPKGETPAARFVEGGGPFWKCLGAMIAIFGRHRGHASEHKRAQKVRELRGPASRHEELRKSGGGNCIVHKPISLGQGCGTIDMGDPLPEGCPPGLQRSPGHFGRGFFVPQADRPAHLT
jgi:hypothetical protein